MQRWLSGILLLLLSSEAALASAVDWLPVPLRSQIENLPATTSNGTEADLFVCNPYCEFVGQFFSKDDFRAGDAAILEEAKKPENQRFLRIALNPYQFTDAAHLAQNHEPQAKETEAASPTPSPSPSEVASESQPAPITQNVDDATPLYIGAHIDTFLGATSLSTGSNTDFASDAEAHAIVGAGLDLDIKNLLPLGKGYVSATFDLGYLHTLGEKSSISSGQTWTSQAIRILSGAIWEWKDSPFKLGLLLEGRQETNTASADEAIGFSTTSIWASPGVLLQYRKTSLQVFRSVYSSVQDIEQYRGTSVSSSRTAFELNSCKGLASILGGEFQICFDGMLTLNQVTGNGTPLQPVFTTDPSYKYTSWQGGLQFRIVGISP